MKTKSLWFATAAAVVLTGMTMMTSCSKDDYELPEVIESEVYDEGRAEEVKAEVGTEGTQLSYESWIMVRGITRASFDNKVSVTLNNTLNNNETLNSEVSGYEMGSPKVSVSYQLAEQKKDGFVTISDSVLVYSVAYKYFTLDYRLVYQVAVYDDGITKKVMPYHRIDNIVDKGYTIEDMDIAPDEKGNIFARKKYTHTIGVTCNGESYDVTSTRILMRFLSSGGPYIKSSKIIDEGLARNGEQYSSWLKVEQSWSTGEVKTETYSVDLTSFARGKEAVSRVIPDTNLQRLSSEMNEISSENVYSPCDYVDVVRYTKEYIVHYNYFDVGYDIMQDVPVYDDGITYHVMPALDFGEVEEKMWFEGGEETTYQGKPCYLWDYYHQISIVFGDIKQSAYVSFSAFVMK